MCEAQFYYRDSNAPKPNKPNHIGVFNKERFIKKKQKLKDSGVVVLE
jgi:hypothetical protein